MLTINSIDRGIVIDHIKVGHGLKIFNYLKLDKADYPVALIMNVKSDKMGQKDIIKIENRLDVDLTALAFLDTDLTINVIEDGKVGEKRDLRLPSKLVNVMECDNPRCITSVERGIKQEFYLCDSAEGIYRCTYCDEVHNKHKEL